MLNGWEWVIVAAVVLLLFGGTQIPKLARSLGQAQKEFKSGLKEGAAEESDDDEADSKADSKADSSTD